MEILVTGGAAHIGSHTVNALERSGHRSVILDSLSPGYGWAPLSGKHPQSPRHRYGANKSSTERVLYWYGKAVFAAAYPTENGTAVREYSHVNDLASTHRAALEYLRKNGASRTFNVATGHHHAVHQCMEVAEHVGKAAPPYRASDRFPGGAAVWVADNCASPRVIRTQAAAVLSLRDNRNCQRLKLKGEA